MTLAEWLSDHYSLRPIKKSPPKKRSNFLIKPFSPRPFLSVPSQDLHESCECTIGEVRGASGTRIVSIIILASTTIACVIHLRQYFLIWINNVTNLHKNISRQDERRETVIWWQQPVQTDRDRRHLQSWGLGCITKTSPEGFRRQVSYLQDAYHSTRLSTECTY